MAVAAQKSTLGNFLPDEVPRNFFSGHVGDVVVFCVVWVVVQIKTHLVAFFNFGETHGAAPKRPFCTVDELHCFENTFGEVF